jgi:hypothetical protein
MLILIFLHFIFLFRLKKLLNCLTFINGWR